ncbi:MAG: protein translocase subunit SecF, partial [Acidimicrobiales bacterium]
MTDLDAPVAEPSPETSPRAKRKSAKQGRGPLGRLYHGETKIDFIGRTKVWFALSIVFLLIGGASLLSRGLNLGIDFKGGAIFTVESTSLTVEQARTAATDAGVSAPIVREATSDTTRRVQVQTPKLDADQTNKVRNAIATTAKVDVAQVLPDVVGASWGKEISDKAIRALIVFLIVITLYISVRFEFKMAVPTLIALVHDVLMTIGIYSLSGLEVTPATVVAILTILGFSIYDGIVVFDKVHENTRLVSATGRMAYGDMVNLSLNETLMRSLNTSITALIPIASLLIIGSLVLGARTLEEFGLALLIGLASGAYSSIFIASPFLAVFKEREPRYRDVRRRIAARGDRVVAETAPQVDVSVVGGDEADERVEARAGHVPTRSTPKKTTPQQQRK